ncbi:MAG: hypothetical protein KDD73_15660 [Anaerolineales bacterium]|nr:hypothetical protein [Anaerolineales bacterium]MCB9127384.1 adenylate kinase [Ardenticatenales bacterium]MCB9172716.1 adenylate kinase [Ardenticatenales bacterium]
MNSHRLHIFGASGAGTSTLGRALGARLSLPVLDADDYYWQQTDPPFVQKNAPETRVRHLLADMDHSQGWILSGSVVSWGNALMPLFTAAIFITLPPAIRLARLQERERLRYGTRIAPGGDMHDASRAFLRWAALYDTAGEEMRSLTLHERWLAQLTCPVIRLTSTAPVDLLVDQVLAALGGGEADSSPPL